MHALESFLRTLSFIAVASLSLFGCKQEQGELCEVESDCGSGLECCNADLPLRRGLCQPEGACETRDAGPRLDAGATDAGATDAGATDAGATDAGATDAGTADGGQDAGPVDSGDAAAG